MKKDTNTMLQWTTWPHH